MRTQTLQTLPHDEKGGSCESCQLELARMDAAFALPGEEMSTMQFTEIQAGRTAFVRWPVEPVRIAPGPLHVLLAQILLVCTA